MKTEHKSVLDYLKNNKFLIPTYQRTYIWTEDECEQLWDDLLSFFDNKEDDEKELKESELLFLHPEILQ